MSNLVVRFNEENYNAEYNRETGYFEIELNAPKSGGLYNLEMKITDILGNVIIEQEKVQVLTKEKTKLDMDKVFLWIFDYKDFEVKDIIEIFDYDLKIDEETNSISTVKAFRKSNIVKNDIVAVKINNRIEYWGVIDSISNENGEAVYTYSMKYITNMYNQDIILNNETLIKNNGIEDFIESEINRNFINNSDTFVNKNYLSIRTKTHNKKQVSVSNVNNNIYNLHTWMTNCTQNYDVVYNFYIENKALVMEIEKKDKDKILIDVNAMNISNYNEIFETDIVSKVVVLTSTKTYNLYLLTDRTTTTDPNNVNRAEGRTETIYVENYTEAEQAALDKMKANSYNHNVTFTLHNKRISIGTPIAIKTKNSVILDTYISAVQINNCKSIQYTCGNIRTNFIDKLLKERRK